MIFIHGKFTFASGLQSNFKIDCDDLTDDELYTLALQSYQFLPRFKEVYGVPTGGLRFAEQMRKFVSEFGNILVVDDVFTTGKSINNFVEVNNFDRNNVRGLVIFARNTPPVWIKSIFTMSLVC